MFIEWLLPVSYCAQCRGTDVNQEALLLIIKRPRLTDSPRTTRPGGTYGDKGNTFSGFKINEGR